MNEAPAADVIKALCEGVAPFDSENACRYPNCRCHQTWHDGKAFVESLKDHGWIIVKDE